MAPIDGPPNDTVVVMPSFPKQNVGTVRPLTEAVVLGRVVAVEPGRGFWISGEDAPDGIETTFQDPRALWRTVHVHVDVQSVLSGSVPGDRIVVGFAFGPQTPLSRVRDGFEAFGDVLFFLNRSPVFAYDTSLYGVVQDGAVVGVVDGDGRIQLPAMEDDEAAQLLRGSSTVDQLRSAVRGPERVVQVDATGARVRP